MERAANAGSPLRICQWLAPRTLKRSPTAYRGHPPVHYARVVLGKVGMPSSQRKMGPASPISWMTTERLSLALLRLCRNVAKDIVLPNHSGA